MTVINNVQINDIQYTRNLIKEAIQNNDPIEDKLRVILVISNPCMYARRFVLLNEFVQRMELEEPDVLVYVVELLYKDQNQFIVTSPKNKRHLQIKTEAPLWHKENMINMAIRHLFPPTWKAFAWIDADVDFENPTWAKDTLKVLNGSKDIVQLFSHAVDMKANGEAMNTFVSFGYQYTKGNPYANQLTNFWHPGYGWACTRKAYEKMGGLYELAVLGSGDHIMSLCYVQQGMNAINELSSSGYKQSVALYQERVKSLRLGYIPGVIRHYYHGTKENRKYKERWQILIKYDFDPYLHLTTDESGIMVPTDKCPPGLLTEIAAYFSTRNEDDIYKKGILKKKQVTFAKEEVVIVPPHPIQMVKEDKPQVEDVIALSNKMMMIENIMANELTDETMKSIAKEISQEIMAAEIDSIYPLVGVTLEVINEVREESAAPKKKVNGILSAFYRSFIKCVIREP